MDLKEVWEEVRGDGQCKGPGAETGLSGNRVGWAQQGSVWLG